MNILSKHIREPFNALSHLAGAILAILCTVFLMARADSDPTGIRLGFMIYGITVFLMFGSSALYHWVHTNKRAEEFFRLIDHIMIYLVIAGTYTPVILVGLENEWKFHMLAFIWFFALGGVFSKIFWFNAPRWISTIMYLLMGWLSLIILPEIWQLMDHGFVVWIAIGGASYSAGAIIYAVKKPDPLPEIFGFHEIWHLFVLGGAFSHFWGIYRYLPGL